MSQSPDPDSIESRRSSTSQRRMTLSRKVTYALGLPLLRLILWLLRKSYRYQPLIGAEHRRWVMAEDKPIAPCYWHQQHVLCSTEIAEWISKGFKGCYLISGSVDGDVPERIARKWGAEVIRGSANKSGALALRDMQKMMRDGYSIVTTADGPRGPCYEFKEGAILMARIGKVPIIPMAAAADRAWYLKRWDRFMIPKPFAKVVVGVGAPYVIDPKTPMNALEPVRTSVQAAVMSVMRECEACISSSKTR